MTASDISSDEIKKKQRIREFALNELVDSEIFYFRNLCILESCLLEPFIDFLYERSECPPNFKAIHDSLIDIINLSETLLKTWGCLKEKTIKEMSFEPQIKFDLYKKIDLDISINSSKIIKELHDIGPFFKQYSVYLDLHWQSSDLFQEIFSYSSANDKSKFLINLEKNPLCDGLDIHSFLILPVQRIPRYVLLLERILKNTLSNDELYEPLESTYHLLEEIAQNVNSQMADIDSSMQLISLYRKIQGATESILKPHRKVLKIDKVSKMTRKGAFQERQLVLFNDALLYCYTDWGFGRLVYLHSIELLEDQAKGSDLGFTIQAPSKSFTIYCETLEEATEWKEAIANAIVECQNGDITEKSEERAGIWLPDDQYENCMICDKPFSRLFRWKHHCRLCGWVLCDSCSSFRLNDLKQFNGESVRVCKDCYLLGKNSHVDSDQLVEIKSPLKIMKESSFEEIQETEDDVNNELKAELEEISKLNTNNIVSEMDSNSKDL
eukprot:TRINITY_DN4545_c0_g1_i1.p1 TRINITY_DN4545_c0_g1~~TRINITY_DN4545_c0_g1_i1.p1  ORF type:complete len:496 (-),score=153.53 TRINITY_DN4545_c0_g1_i1:94-1581(-)